MLRSGRTLLIPLLTLLAACNPTPRADRAGVEAVSLLTGEPLPPVPISADRRAEFEKNLAEARARYDADPKSEDSIIWLGRRLAYLGRYREAIDTFTRGLSVHPDSVKLLRHRGHRYITTRRFDLALRDLRRAADLIRTRNIADEVEPDGLPNARNIPRSTLHDNVFYHLALAHYLRGEFAAAAEAWRTGLERIRPNDDMLVAYSYWLCLAEHRAGRADRAAAVLASLPPLRSLDIIENHAYHRLLGVFRGEVAEADALPPGDGPEGASIDAATTLYGLGAWALAHGDPERARGCFERALATNQWPAFGFIAAEADLAREQTASRPTPPEPRTQEEILRELQQERRRSR